MSMMISNRTAEALKRLFSRFASLEPAELTTASEGIPPRPCHFCKGTVEHYADCPWNNAKTELQQDGVIDDAS